MIDHATVERIQSTALIKEVVEDFIALRKSGAGYKGLCPFHDDRTPSLSISPARNIFKCFVCGEGGTPVHFVMKHEKISYYEALRYLAKKYNIEVKETAMTDEQRQAHDDRESMLILNSYAQDTFSKTLWETDEGRSIGLSYFYERGFREDTIRKFQLGYALDKLDAFTQQALAAGYKSEYLEKTGLSIKTEKDKMFDRFRGRVIFPIHSISGKTSGFGGRILLSAKTDKLAKYINSPDSEVYHKNNELYGIFLGRKAIAKEDKCFLVEGYTDVISMHQSGIENVVAPCGTALTDNQIRLIRRLTNNITLLNDGDTAGQNATMKDIPLLLEAGMKVRIVALPEGDDPDSFARSHSASQMREYIAANEVSFVHFKAAKLIKEAAGDPYKIDQIITEIVDTIAIIDEEITRISFVKECSRITGYDENTIGRRIAKKRQELLVKRKKDLYPEAANPADNPPPRDDFPPPLPPEYDAPAEEDFQQPTTLDIDQYEQTVVRFVVRYGETDLTKGEEHPKRVAEYVTEEFEADALKFTNPLYQQILEEAFEHCTEPNFSAEKYFLNHPDPSVSRLAVNLTTDPYVESKIHNRIKAVPKEVDQLTELVPYVVINYKYALLEQQIKDLEKDIREAEQNDDFEQVMLLIKFLNAKTQVKKMIAETLRERIISK